MYTTIWPPMCKKYSGLDGSVNIADVQCTAFDSTLTYRSIDSTLTYRPILRYLYFSFGLVDWLTGRSCGICTPAEDWWTDLPADPAVLVLQLRAGGLTPLKVVPEVPVVERGQVPLRKGLRPEAQHLVDLCDVGTGIQLHPWSKYTKD